MNRLTDCKIGLRYKVIQMNFEPKDSARLFSEFQFGSSHSCRNADVPTTTRSVVRSFTVRIARVDRD